VREQLDELVAGCVGQSAQDVNQIREGFDVVHLAGGDEAEMNRGRFAAAVAADPAQRSPPPRFASRTDRLMFSHKGLTLMAKTMRSTASQQPSKSPRAGKSRAFVGLELVGFMWAIARAIGPPSPVSKSGAA
jgi:hypothetical protein